MGIFLEGYGGAEHDEPDEHVDGDLLGEGEGVIDEIAGDDIGEGDDCHHHEDD